MNGDGVFSSTMLALFLGGSLIFLVGFFPVSYENLDPDANKIDDDTGRPTSLDGIRLQPPDQQFAQTILMIVDAMRFDFPSAENMPFAYEQTCAHLQLRVNIPTVTLPRLKSLVTGTVSSFIDIVLNLGHAEPLQDSLLHRLKKRGDILVFAGDRTWTNLFPSEFRRQQPNMDSFFVQDFYEGDKNVTSALGKELLRTDWTLLVLHYLGLDHIGHVEGSESAKIPDKLRQMDDVIKQMYRAKYYRDQLVLLTGDHGMRNGGGHGGSTFEELHVPLLFFKENCIKKSSDIIEYDQIDLAATLSILLATDIPSKSIGCLIPELIAGLSPEHQLYAYYYNALHLLDKAQAHQGRENVAAANYFQWFEHAKRSHKEYLSAARNNATPSSLAYENAKLEYLRASRAISSILSESLVRFSYDLIVVGLSLTTTTTIYVLFSLLCPNAFVNHSHSSIKQILLAMSTAIVMIAWCFYNGYISSSSIVISCLLSAPIAVSIYFVTRLIWFALQPQQRMGPLCLPFTLPLPLLGMYLLQVFFLGSSSYIEREQLSRHYLGATMFIMLFVRVYRAKISSTFDESSDQGPQLLLVARQMWRSLMVIVLLLPLHLLNESDTWSRKTNKPWFSVVLALELAYTVVCVERLSGHWAQLVPSALAALMVYCFHGINGSVSFLTDNFNATVVLRVFWSCVAANAVIGYAAGIRSLTLCGQKLRTHLSCAVLIMALLQKPRNVILLPIMLLMLEEAYKLCDKLRVRSGRFMDISLQVQKSLVTIFVANMFFFYQGNSNSLATIDLNPGFIGQSSYNAVIVGALVTLNTYCAPINAFIAFVLHLTSSLNEANQSSTSVHIIEQTERGDLTIVLRSYVAASMLPVAVFLWLMVAFRYHLFIYSVFAPKVLYECFGLLVFYLTFLISSVTTV